MRCGTRLERVEKKKKVGLCVERPKKAWIADADVLFVMMVFLD